MARRVLKNLALVAILAGNSAGLAVLASETNEVPPARVFAPKFPDVSKSRIELPVKGIIGDLRMPIASDMKGKRSESVRVPAPQSSAKTLGSSQKSPLKPGSNQKVEPGKVRWHRAIQTAMEASSQSGKPVLLFQMMGRLDDRFC